MRYTATIRSVIMTVTFILMSYSAQPAMAAGSGGVPQTIPQVVVEGNRIFVFSPVAYANPDGCSTTGYAVIDAGLVAQPDWVASTILSAFNAGKKMVFYFYGCVATNWDASAPVAGTFTVLQ